MDWISVNDHLPEPQKDCGERPFVVVYCGRVSFGHFYGKDYFRKGDGGWRITWVAGDDPSSGVTHWLELPEPPK